MKKENGLLRLLRDKELIGLLVDWVIGGRMRNEEGEWIAYAAKR